MHPNFNVPCAHWKDPDDPIVLEGIKLTFGKILLSHENTDHDPQGVLSLLLAAMVHHYDWILTICQEHPKHPFNSISLFSSPLLAKLKDCLTMELNSHVPIVTGIPPFVEQLCRINRHEAIAKSIKEDVGNVVEVLEEAVSNAIDKKVKADGGINSSILDERLKKFQDLLMQRLDEVGGTMASCPVEPEVAITGNQIDILQRKNTFYYRGKFWCVPESFAFPSEVTRLNGWRMWLKGKAVVVDNKTYMIKPFSHLKGSDLPWKELVNELDTKWKPIFRKMAEALGLVIPAEVDDEFVQTSFHVATEYLKATVSYIWIRAKDEGQLSKYTIGTWSRKVARSEILKHGTPEDKERLPPSTARNKEDSRKRGGWSVERTGIRRVARRSRVDRLEVQEAAVGFERAFGDNDGS